MYKDYNVNESRTTVYLTKQQKRFLKKEKINLSYFVREKLDRLIIQKNKKLRYLTKDDEDIINHE